MDLATCAGIILDPFESSSFSSYYNNNNIFFKDNQIICLRRFCHIGTSREQVYFFHKTPVSLQFPIAVLLSNEQEFRSNLLNALERQGKRHSRRISDSRTSKISSVVDHTAANPECWVLRVVYQ